MPSIQARAKKLNSMKSQFHLKATAVAYRSQLQRVNHRKICNANSSNGLLYVQRSGSTLLDGPIVKCPELYCLHDEGPDLNVARYECCLSVKTIRTIHATDLL